MAAGENPETIARQAADAAISAAVEAGQDFVAVAEAASLGATSGAIESAMETGSDPSAAAEAAGSGARTGATQAAQRSGQDAAAMAALQGAAQQGSQQALDQTQEEVGFVPEAPELEPAPEIEEPITQDEAEASPFT